MTFPYWAGPHAGSDESGPQGRLPLKLIGEHPPTTAPDGDPDRALLTRVRHGDVNALTTLFDAYMPALVRFVSGIVGSADVARDITQDTFVALWENRSTIEPRTTVRAFLFISARGRALHVVRRTRLERRYQEQLISPASTGILPRRPDEYAEDDEIMAAVATAMATLSPRVRQAAELRWYGALSYAEIAKILGVSERTINNQLTTAVKLLRQLLECHRTSEAPRPTVSPDRIDD